MMPFKFKLYNILCYATILLTAAMFLDLCYSLTRDDVVGGPFWGFLLLILFFICYFSLPVIGISMVKAYNAKQDISHSKLVFLRIIFFIQICFQLFILYNLPETIRDIRLLFDPHSPFYGFRLEGPIMEILLNVICLFTIYLEIFSFPLVKLLRTNYLSLLKQLDEMGSS